MSRSRRQVHKWVYEESIHVDDYVKAAINAAMLHARRLIKSLSSPDPSASDKDVPQEVLDMKANREHLRKLLARQYTKTVYNVRYVEVPRCFKITDFELKAAIEYYNAAYNYTIGLLRSMRERITQLLTMNIQTKQSSGFFDVLISSTVHNCEYRYMSVNPVCSIPIPVGNTGFVDLIADIHMIPCRRAPSTQTASTMSRRKRAIEESK